MNRVNRRTVEMDPDTNESPRRHQYNYEFVTNPSRLARNGIPPTTSVTRLLDFQNVAIYINEKLPKILPKWGNFAKPGHTGHHPTRPNLQIKRKNCPNRRKEEKIKERNEMIIAGETEIEI